PSGSQLPNSAEVSGSAWATYRFPVTRFKAEGYVHLQWSYSDERLDSITPAPFENTNAYPQFTLPSYDIGDLSVGLEGNTWEVSIFANNITDERANFGQRSLGGWSLYSPEDGRDHVAPFYTNRPREFGLRVIKRWGGR
ncbi:MAG: TonB-dependent receptor, partial [Chromatocurvus sp.]